MLLRSFKIRHCAQPSGASAPWRNDRSTQKLRLEGTSGGHLVHALAQAGIPRLPRTMPRWLLIFPRRKTSQMLSAACANAQATSQDKSASWCLGVASSVSISVHRPLSCHWALLVTQYLSLRRPLSSPALSLPICRAFGFQEAYHQREETAFGGCITRPLFFGWKEGVKQAGLEGQRRCDKGPSLLAGGRHHKVKNN